MFNKKLLMLCMVMLLSVFNVQADEPANTTVSSSQGFVSASETVSDHGAVFIPRAAVFIPGAAVFPPYIPGQGAIFMPGFVPRV